LPARAEGTPMARAAHRARLPRRRHAAERGGARAGASRSGRQARDGGRDRRRDHGARIVLGIYGGSFDPPHAGHVALVRAAKEKLGLDRVVVVVVANPGHKSVDTPPDARFEMARAAFPGDEVVLDDHARTVDMLRAHPEWHGATLLIGADELADFSNWKEPSSILGLVRLGVATRPGHDVE